MLNNGKGYTFNIQRRVEKEPLLYKTSTLRLKSWRGNGSNIILLFYFFLFLGKGKKKGYIYYIECSVMMKIMGANNWIENAINSFLFLSVYIAIQFLEWNDVTNNSKYI